MHHFREPFSGFSHLIGAILAAAGLTWLVAATWDDPVRLTAMIVYGVTLVALYTASSVLHLVKAPPRVELWLNRLDHAAIYLFIAGTYTPFCVSLLSGGWQWGTLTTIWTLAIAGVTYRLVRPLSSGVISTLLYVAMGWLALILLPLLVPVMPLPMLALTLAGGLVYSVGAIFYALDNPLARPRFSYHDLWHLFVLTGSLLHFIVVALYLV